MVGASLVVGREQAISATQQLSFAEAPGEPDIYPFLRGLDRFPMITEVLAKKWNLKLWWSVV